MSTTGSIEAAVQAGGARRSVRAYLMMMGFGFRAAPVQTTGQLLTGVIMALTAPAGAYGGKLIIDELAGGRAGSAFGIGVALSILLGIALVTVFIYVACVFAVIERAGARADRRLMELAGGTDEISHHERTDYLDQMQRIREERGMLAGMVNSTSGVVRALVGLIAAAVLLSTIHPVLLGLLGLAAVSAVLGRRGTAIEIAANEATSEPERRRRHLFEVGTAAATGKELRIFGAGRALIERHRRVAAEVDDARTGAGWRATRLRLVDAVITAAGYVGAIVVVISLALTGSATPGDVVLAIGLAAQLGGMVQIGVGYGSNLLQGLRTGYRLSWLEDYAAGARHRPDSAASGTVGPPARLSDAITLTDVSFGYPDTDRMVLSDVSLRLPAGSVVALVGENGAGKTTLVKLLSGFYQPSAGRISLDDQALAELDPADWRRRVSATFQDFVAFEFLAREAIGIGDLDRLDDTEAVARAVERADAGPVITGLPDGLESQLGTAWGGVGLSGGQWQRLALARGLIRPEPLLVILDEPTAALDPQTEYALFERFTAAAGEARTRGGVTLLVSHRFSTVRMADLIIVLDGGRVREVGDHDTLVAQHGLYAELYELQSRAYR